MIMRFARTPNLLASALVSALTASLFCALNACAQAEESAARAGSKVTSKLLIALALGLALPLVPLHADTVDGTDQAAELAKKLQNPVASLVQVPIQNNWDFGIGPANAMRYTANIQPVVPFSLNEDWNLVTRTILPVIYAESPTVGGSAKSGLGDTVQSFFLSPKAPTSGGWIWGAGPVFAWPTATDNALGSEKWGAGPTALLLRQDSGWTYGMLANHIWSYAGDSSRADVNATFLNPFLSYTTKKFTTFGINTESVYDWENRQWTVPLNATVSQLLKIGKQPISLASNTPTGFAPMKSSASCRACLNSAPPAPLRGADETFIKSVAAERQRLMLFYQAALNAQAGHPELWEADLQRVLVGDDNNSYYRWFGSGGHKLSHASGVTPGSQAHQ